MDVGVGADDVFDAFGTEFGLELENFGVGFHDGKGDW
jgi:hypothetical protein